MGKIKIDVLKKDERYRVIAYTNKFCGHVYYTDEGIGNVIVTGKCFYKNPYVPDALLKLSFVDKNEVEIADLLDNRSEMYGRKEAVHLFRSKFFKNLYDMLSPDLQYKDFEVKKANININGQDGYLYVNCKIEEYVKIGEYVNIDR